VRLGNEIGSVLPVLCKFAAKYNVLATRSKNLTERNHVKLFGGGD
jgi:hypothetical protein